MVTTTSVGVDWYKQLDENSTMQLSTSIVRYDTRVATLGDFRSHHFRLAASYSRSIGQRLSVGADIGARAIASGWAGCRIPTSADRCSSATAWVTLDDRARSNRALRKRRRRRWLINHLPTILWHRRIYVIIPAVLLFRRRAGDRLQLADPVSLDGDHAGRIPGPSDRYRQAPGTGEIEKRIAQIREQVLSRGDLISLIEQNDLYESERRSKPMSTSSTRCARRRPWAPLRATSVRNRTRKENVIAIT